MDSCSCFCCSAICPFRPQRLQHEGKFTDFMAWAKYPRGSQVSSEFDLAAVGPNYVVQLVRQVNYGPLESKRYFAPWSEGGAVVYHEVSEANLIQNNFQKLNSYKNFRCDVHNKFFELNLYQKDPVNLHHWRANIARPADAIDL